MIGRNLAIDDSFTLSFTNKTSSPFTVQLFNLGGSSSEQTSFTTSLVSAQTSGGVGFDLQGIIVNDVVVATLDISLYFADLTFLGPFSFPIGTTVAQINTFFDNNVVNQQGQVGSFVLQQVAGSPTLYSSVITVPNFAFNLYQTFSAPFVFINQFYVNQLLTFVSGNPYIQVGGTADINFIQNSEVGNSYRIMGVDVITNNQDQLLQDINYGSRGVNGNVWGASFTPTIDPYQNNSVSLHAIGSSTPIGEAMDNFTITTDTTFSYTILGNTFSRLTFSYVRASEANMNLFNQAVASELLMKFAAEKKYLDSLKYRKGVFLQ
jgi:hypothetical protein